MFAFVVRFFKRIFFTFKAPASGVVRNAEETTPLLSVQPPAEGTTALAITKLEEQKSYLISIKNEASTKARLYRQNSMEALKSGDKARALFQLKSSKSQEQLISNATQKLKEIQCLLGLLRQRSAQNLLA
jgi:hypothetical protein